MTRDMTREEAIHKMEYSKRAYQMLIDEKVQEGVLVGKGINAEWSADTPIIDAYKDMLEACDMAIKALEQEPKTGHWEYGYVFADGNYCKCSECKEIIKCIYPMHYCPNCGCRMVELQESDHKCHTCKHYTSGEHDGSCSSYICKGYSNWESKGEG